VFPLTLGRLDSEQHRSRFEGAEPTPKVEGNIERQVEPALAICVCGGRLFNRLDSDPRPEPINGFGQGPYGTLVEIDTISDALENLVQRSYDRRILFIVTIPLVVFTEALRVLLFLQEGFELLPRDD
jgi:hypothetical protein